MYAIRSYYAAKTRSLQKIEFMPELQNKPTLNNFQEYVSELEKERGFFSQTIRDKCLLLGEEVGELFKAVRKAEGLLVDSNSNFNEIGDELADIFIYLCAIANRT